MAHGRQDDVVAYDYGFSCKEQLEAHDVPVDWHEYDIGHAVCIEEIQHIRQWLTETI